MIYYIQSEDAFGRARMRGRVQVAKALFTGHDPHLLSFRQAVGGLRPVRVVHRGLQDILVKDIVGSVGREKEFTRHFHPLTSSARQKERWRLSYALSRAGRGYPPIEVCKVGGDYFVVNGHHRVSVAKYLNWKTIQACVSEVALPAVK
jgi:hypothetical protein